MGRIEIGAISYIQEKPQLRELPATKKPGTHAIARRRLAEVLQTQIERQTIHRQVTKAREGLLAEEKDEIKSRLTYNIDMDTVAYQTLFRYQNKEEAYGKIKTELNEYTKFQLQTMLGERYHTGLSTFHLRINNGEIYPEGTEEPFLAMIKRGRDYRKLHGSNEDDQKRENAEVIGFEKVQKVLCDPDTPVGTMILSISLPGEKDSIYHRNFYDIHTKTNNGINSRRYSSALDGAESLKKVREINPSYGTDGKVTDAFFLANPIAIRPGETRSKTPDDIHRYLHQEHDTMSKEAFEELIRVSMPAIQFYVQLLCENPYDDMMSKRSFNAILVEADAAEERIREKGQHAEKIIYSYEEVRRLPLTRADVMLMGTLTVRQVDTGCGLSAGFAISGMFGSPVTPMGVYSVGAFGIKNNRPEDDPKLCRCFGQSSHFHCPGKRGDCKNEIVVGKGITTCSKCGEGKKC